MQVADVSPRVRHHCDTPYLSVATTADGIGGAALAALREGFAPLHVNDICGANVRAVHTVLKCKTFVQDATTEGYRSAVHKFESYHGIPTVRFFSPECKDNSSLNKYASPTLNESRETGGKRLWDSLSYFEAMLDGQPAFIVCEQLPNFRRTKPYKLMLKAAAREGYRADAFVLHACAFGLPTDRRRLFIVFQRDRYPVGVADYLNALHRAGIQRNKSLNLGSWCPESELFWLPLSHDLYTTAPLIVTGDRLFPSVNTKSADREQPSYDEYKGGSHPLKERATDADTTRHTYNEARVMSPRDICQLQGFPRDWPIASGGMVCRCSDPCKSCARWGVSKMSAQLGNALPVASAQAVFAAIRLTLERARLGDGAPSPAKAAESWRPTCASRSVLDKGPAAQHQATGERADTWSKDGHWATQQCLGGICPCCTPRGCKACADIQACSTEYARSTAARVYSSARAVVAAFNLQDVRPLTAPSNWDLPDDVVHICSLEVHEDLQEVDDWLNVASPVDVRLTQVECQAYLDQRGEKPQAKTYSKADVDIARDNMSPTEIKRLQDMVDANWDRLFVKDSESLPLPFLERDAATGELVPATVEYAFKADAKHVRVPCPRFPPGSAKTRVLEEVLETGLKTGLLVLVEESKDALRPMLVGKFDASADRAGVPTAIRLCGDFPPLNAQCEKVTARSPHIEEQVRKMEGYHYYVSLDASGQYHSFILALRSSMASSIWFPRGGRQVLARYTRMTMGALNSGATAQAAFNRMFATDLAPKYANRVANAADDICFGADSIDELLDILEEVFRVLRLHQVQLKPTKLHVGQSYVDFWGRRYNKNGVSLSPRNLSPALRMRPATNLAELRALLGYLNQWGQWLGPPITLSDPAQKRREALQGYRLRVAPLMQLLSTKDDNRKISERWSPDCTSILEEFKQRLIAGAHLHTPIRDGRGFTLITDSSEFGWGALLCQYNDDRELILIDHWSAPHTGYGKHAPAFYNEARAILEGMERSAPYLATCPKALTVLTDSLSLAWIAKTRGKSGISPWRWVRVQEMPHEIHYLPGPRNPADAISRPPFLGPHQFATAGLRELVAHLLDCLPNELRGCKKPWLAMEKKNDTERLARQLQRWRSGRNPIQTFSASESRTVKADFDLAILSPGVYHAPAVFQALAGLKMPWAILGPTDMIQYLPERADRHSKDGVDENALAAIDNARKVIHLGCGMTWLVGNTSMARDVVCCLAKDLALREELGRGDMSAYEPEDTTAPAATATMHLDGDTWRWQDTRPPWDPETCWDPDAKVKRAPCGPWPSHCAVGTMTAMAVEGDTSYQPDACCWDQCMLRGFLRQHAALSCSVADAWEPTSTTIDAAPAPVVHGAADATAPTSSTPSAFTAMCATPERWMSEQREVQSAPEYKDYLIDIVSADDGLLYYTAKRTRYLLLVVPRAFRRYITMKTHVALYHLTEKYTRLKLLDTYWWPSLSRDVRLFLDECSECDDVRGQQFAAHAMYRARPSSRPGAIIALDFKGMTESSAESGSSKELLVFLDLGSSRLRLSAQKGRSAAETLRSFIAQVTTEWGVPLVVHSDLAAEFTGRVVGKYCSDLGIQQINTRGYNPRGNAAVERVMRYLNQCFTALTDAQYREWPWYLGTMRAAWEDHVVDSMGVSPYQATHGVPRRTPADALAPTLPPDADPGLMSSTDVATLAASQRAFSEAAARAMQFTREATAKRLNERGHKRVFKLGDKVKFYKGVTAAMAKQRGRKAKHCSFYVPGVITETYPEHPSVFKIKCDSSGRSFMRCAINIARRRAQPGPAASSPTPPNTSGGQQPLGPTSEPCPGSTDSFAVGDLIAAIDSVGDVVFWLSKVTAVSESAVSLWIHGTTAKSLTPKAKFLPLYTYYENKGKTRVSYSTQYPQNHPGCEKWTYELATSQLPGLILARRLVLTPNGALTGPSLKVLGGLGTYVHAKLRAEK